MSACQRFYLSIGDSATARGADPAFAFDGSSPQALAQAVQAALSQRTLFERWRAVQPDPDAVDPALARFDPEARAEARQADLSVDLIITTTLPMYVLKHRLRLLIGTHWTLHDVRAA